MDHQLAWYLSNSLLHMYCARDVEQEHGKAHLCFSILTSYSGTHVPQVPPQSKNMGPGLIVCLKTKIPNMRTKWYMTKWYMYICTKCKATYATTQKIWYLPSPTDLPTCEKSKLNSTNNPTPCKLHCTVTLTFWPDLLPPLHDDPGWPWQLHKLSCDLPIHDRVGATLHTLHHSCITSVSLNSL